MQFSSGISSQPEEKKKLFNGTTINLGHYTGYLKALQIKLEQVLINEKARSNREVSASIVSLSLHKNVLNRYKLLIQPPVIMEENLRLQLSVCFKMLVQLCQGTLKYLRNRNKL